MTENAAPRRPKRKILRIFTIIIGCIVGAVVLAGLVWRYTGSGKWVLQSEEDGIKVYSLKAPGTGIVKYKGITKVHSSLGTIVALMTDPALCDDLGCHDWRALDVQQTDGSLSQIIVSQFDLPFKLRSREYVSADNYSQDPQTKVVHYRIVAAPGKIPQNPCCVRVSHMNNEWVYSPLPNGEVEVTYIMDMDEGGAIPDVMENYFHPQFLVGFLSNLQALIDKERGKNRTAAFIREL